MNRNVSSNLRKSLVWRSIRIFPRTDLKKITVITCAQIALSLLDLAGVAAIGALGALSVTGIQSETPGTRVNKAIEFLGISEKSFQFQAAILGILAAIFLVSRTFLSIFLTRATLRFLSRRSALVSSRLFSKLLSGSLTDIQDQNSQQILYATTNGVSTVILGVVGSLVSLISDGALLFVLSVGLFALDSGIAIATYLLFGGMGFILYFALHRRARLLGLESSQLQIQSNKMALEAINAYRDYLVRGRRGVMAQKITQSRYSLARNISELSFMPNISKYVLEISLVVGGIAIAAIQFSTTTASRAVATIVVFIAAGSRIAPAVLRIQQGALLIRSSLGTASPTLDLFDKLQEVPEIGDEIEKFDPDHKGFVGKIRLNGITMRYPGNSEDALTNVSLEINHGSFVALTGKSGSGKSTLVDLIVGARNPQLGKIEISELPPLQVHEKWPGAVSYVPQNVYLFEGSILENIAIGFASHEVKEDAAWKALELAGIDEFVKGLPEQIHTNVGENGARLSGGQKQRIGIARALYTSPKVLILDESTSALDSESEEKITNSIRKMKGQTTLIVIAHRPSTIKDADKVYSIENGNIYEVR